MIMDWWRARKARRSQLAALERDDTVDLTTAMRRLDEVTEAAKRANGVGVEHVAERVNDATQEAITILEEAVATHDTG